MSSPSSSPSSSTFYSPVLNPIQISSSNPTAPHLNIPIEPISSSSSPTKHTTTSFTSIHQTKSKPSHSISSSIHPIINLTSESHSPHQEQHPLHRSQHDRMDSNQTTSTTLTNQHPSKTVLTVALAKAQSAVLLDTALQIPEAIEAYTQAVLLLEEVIEKIEELGQERENRELESLLRDQTRDKLWADELWSKFGSSEVPTECQRQEIEDRLKDREAKWNEKRSKMEKRKKARADEEDRLVGIHNTYAGRIRELEAELAHVNDHSDLADALSHHQLPQHSTRDPHFQPSGIVPPLPPLPSHSSITLLEQSNHPLKKTDSRSNLSQPSKSSLRKNSSSSLLSPLPLRDPEDHRSSSSTVLPHPDQPATPQEEFDVLMPQCERRSFGSDSTTREAQSLNHHSISSYRNRPSSRRPSLMRQTTTPIISSLPQPRISANSITPANDDDDDETKDVVPDHLVNSSTSHSSNLNHAQSSHSSKSVRDRSSSSVSGTSISRLDRMRSNESMTTSTRTSVSSTAFKPDSTLPPLPQASASTINNSTSSPKKETHEDHLDHQLKSNSKSSSSISRPKPSEVPSVPSTKTPQTPRRPLTGRSEKSISVREPNIPLPTQTSQIPRNNSSTTQTTVILSTGNVQDSGTDKLSLNVSSNNKASITPHPRREPTPLQLDTPHKRSHHHPKLSNAGDEVDIDLPSAQDTCSPGTVSIIRSLPSPELPESPRVPTTAPPAPRAVSLIPTIYSRPSNASMMAISSATPSLPMRLRAYSQPGKRGAVSGSIQQPAFPKELQYRAVSNPSHQHLKSSRKSISQVSSNSLIPPHKHPQPGGYAQQPASVYAHASSSVPFVVGGSGSTPPPGELMPYPTNPIRRPFHLMRQIRTTILTGAYVSSKLYVPKQMWQQKGIRLNALESKMKLIELLENGLDLFEHDGKLFLNLMKGGGGGSSSLNLNSTNKMNELLGATERFNKRLESFHEVLDGIENGLAKKLGLGSYFKSLKESKETDGNHHTTTTGFGVDPSSKRFGSGLANKLGKGLDRIAIGRNAGDLIGTYVEGISKLFAHSQIIDAHLSCLGNSIYLDKIGKENKVSIESKLKRVSEFYSIVVCRFVVADMGILLDKFVKKGGNWCS
ncbi:hypothetical protein DFH28DRAFT_960605, partial [Melampsora americana]